MRFDALLHDVVVSVRMLRRVPAFTVTVIATMALGIGATSLVLAVFDTVVLRALPFPGVDRLVVISSASRSMLARPMPLTLGDIATLRARARGFSGFASYRLGEKLELTGAGEPDSLPAMRVSTDFATLGAMPTIGRT